jgi:hypothetical protein
MGCGRVVVFILVSSVVRFEQRFLTADFNCELRELLLRYCDSVEKPSGKMDAKLGCSSIPLAGLPQDSLARRGSIR